MTSQPARTVVAYRDPTLSYPGTAPFDPDECYPEYPFGADALCQRNRVYGAVRQVLALAGLDAGRFSSPDWNPLAELVPRGGTVAIKPNWVRHYHLRGLDVFSIITHPSVLRPLIDYAYKAVGPSGRVWLMDAPLFDTDFATLSQVCQLQELEQQMQTRGVPLTIADLRSLVGVNDHGVVIRRKHRHTWASQGMEFDLGNDSALAPLASTLDKVFGSDYDRRITASYHRFDNTHGPSHCYRVSCRMLEADLVISVPKLKTHKKTGVTLNLKNMIGINTDKNYIPHYRVGAPADGGDEFPDASSVIRRGRRTMVRHAVDLVLGRSGDFGARIAQGFVTAWLGINRSRLEKRAGQKLDPIDIFYRTVQGDVTRTGDWWGNDTCWRCAVDMNTILLYGTTAGVLRHRPVRRYLSVIDGIVGGEGEGPSAPTPRQDGVLLAGFDPVSTDRIAAQVMGFDPSLLRDLQFCECPQRRPLTLADAPIAVLSNDPAWQGAIKPGSSLGFRPHPGWEELFRG